MYGCWKCRYWFLLGFRCSYFLYVQRNNEEHSWNHCCRGKGISITYFCVCVLARALARACVCARACFRECVCVWGGGGTGAGVFLRTYSLIYPVRHALAPYFLRPLWFHHIFRHCLINGTIFRKKVAEHKMSVLIFCTTFIWNISYSENCSARYCHKCKHVFMSSTCDFCRNLVNLEFSRYSFEKASNIKLRNYWAFGLFPSSDLKHWTTQRDPVD
jgi:hypothetical protein